MLLGQMYWPFRSKDLSRVRPTGLATITRTVRLEREREDVLVCRQSRHASSNFIWKLDDWDIHIHTYKEYNSSCYLHLWCVREMRTNC
jgi:hypothetical protein